VLNTGSLFGDVRLDAGDDWFSCLKGQVTGTVYGGKGNDIYVAGSGLSFKENAGEGTDTVQSTISWALGANFENLTLAGNDKIDAVGNRLDNVISGNSAANHLTGAGGADIFVFTEGSGHDVVDDFHHGIDKLDLSAISGLHNFADIKDLISEKHGNAVIDLSDIAGGTTISLHHIDATVLNAADFIFD
jgi:Ca2+-binding RTX toxin-like protein